MIALSIMPPRADEREDTLEDIDWDIPCQYELRHHIYGTGAAEWAVWYRDPAPCGCPSPQFRYFCDGCWGVRSSIATVFCTSCQLRFPGASTIKRVEHI